MPRKKLLTLGLIPLALGMASNYIYVEHKPYVCSSNLSIVNFIFNNQTAKEILAEHPEYSMVIFVNPFIFNGASEVKGYPLVKAYLGVYNPKTKKCENYTERTLIAIDDKGRIVIGDKEFEKYNIDSLKLLQQLVNNLKGNVGDLLELLLRLHLPYDMINRILGFFSFLALPMIALYYLAISMLRLFFYREKTIKRNRIKVKKNKWGIKLYRITGNYKYLWEYIGFLRFIRELIRIKLLSRIKLARNS